MRISGSARNDKTPHQRRKKGPRAVIAVAAASLMIMGLAACGGGDETTGGSSEGGGGEDLGLITEGTLTSASSGEYRPFSYKEDGKLVGFDKDIADAVAKEMGLESDTKTGEFDTLIQGVKTNRYDVVIGSMTPTDKRKEQVSFTDGYYTSGAQAFVQDSSDCTDPSKLKKATVGVARGTTYADFLEGKAWVGEVKTYASDVTALEDLGTGRLDAVVTDKLVGLNQIKEADKPLKDCGELLFEEEPAFAVNKDNEALITALNEALATVKEDGTYAELSKKWFGQDIS